MSLPPLLLARLKQRGIIKESGKRADDGEEVFAESYDKEDDEQTDASERYRGGAPGCPNKFNHYHVCTDFCFDHWREGYPVDRLSPIYLEERQKMLKEFPLPLGWKEIYDAGMRRHYYWCQATDEVSWLSPKHPRAVISEAAQKIAKEMLENTKTTSRSDYQQSRRSVGSRDREKDERRDDSRAGRRVQGRERYRGKDPEREERRRKREDSESEDDREKGSGNDQEIEEMTEREKLKRAKRRGIDPMDPAAYGEAPVGAWSTGLASDGVKTGVDVTANGPLFQSRPYPAPGAILRRNNPDAEKN